MGRNKDGLVRKLKTGCLYFFLIGFLIMVLYPVFYSVIASFKTSGETLAGVKFWPEKWQWQNYAQAWNKANFSTYTMNTVFYAGATMFFCVLSDSLCGYVFARGEFPGKKLIFAVKTAMMFLALGSATMYPQLQILNRIHLNKSLWGLVLVAACTGSVPYIFMVRAFILSLPKEMDEAATIDGCSFLGIFFRITLPMIRPIIATIAVLSFKGAWNDYLFPMIVTFSKPERRTLAVGLYYMSSTTVSANWALMLPGAVIAAAPLIVIYIFLNKYFVESLTAGAVKG